ncbi:MAG: hypothetical protein JXK07_08675 [Spirochaetes bacterium]|nr:hypothetical protein [Spirochaetota bacterium]MBN2771978.1 hypothetical protein [Spirochaetota bacterium]
MKQKVTKKEMLAMMRSVVRLKTPPPKTETPKNVYTRKTKHKRRFRNDSSFFINKLKNILNFRPHPAPRIVPAI